VVQADKSTESTTDPVVASTVEATANLASSMQPGVVTKETRNERRQRMRWEAKGLTHKPRPGSSHSDGTEVCCNRDSSGPSSLPNRSHTY